MSAPMLELAFTPMKVMFTDGSTSLFCVNATLGVAAAAVAAAEAAAAGLTATGVAAAEVAAFSEIPNHPFALALLLHTIEWGYYGMATFLCSLSCFAATTLMNLGGVMCVGAVFTRGDLSFVEETPGQVVLPTGILCLLTHLLSLSVSKDPQPPLDLPYWTISLAACACIWIIVSSSIFVCAPIYLICTSLKSHIEGRKPATKTTQTELGSWMAVDDTQTDDESDVPLETTQTNDGSDLVLDTTHADDESDVPLETTHTDDGSDISLESMHPDDESDISLESMHTEDESIFTLSATESDLESDGWECKDSEAVTTDIDEKVGTKDKS